MALYLVTTESDMGINDLSTE